MVRSAGVGDRRQTIRVHDVEVAGADLGQPGEHGVEVVVNGEVPAGEGVAVAGGESEDQLDRPPRSAPRPSASSLRAQALMWASYRVLGLVAVTVSVIPIGSRPGCTLNTPTP
jgi:hypothetical protein